MLETVTCDHCHAKKIPIGADECPYCGSTFRERWQEARKQDPLASHESMQLALIEAEDHFARFMELDAKTAGKSRHLTSGGIRKAVSATTTGSKAYRDFLGEAVANMWEATKMAEIKASRTFTDVMYPIRRRRWRFFG